MRDIVGVVGNNISHGIKLVEAELGEPILICEAAFRISLPR